MNVVVKTGRHIQGVMGVSHDNTLLVISILIIVNYISKYYSKKREEVNFLLGVILVSSAIY